MNTTAMAFNNGRRAQVISAGRIEKVLSDFDQRLDALSAQLTIPEIRALQAKKAECRAEEQRLHQGLNCVCRRHLCVFAQSARTVAG